MLLLENDCMALSLKCYQNQLVIFLVPHFKTQIGFVWSAVQEECATSSLVFVQSSLAPNNSFVIVGNYFLRKAHLVCTWKSGRILLQEQVLLSYLLKEKLWLNMWAGFLWRWRQPLLLHSYRQLSHLQEILEVIFHIPPWTLHPEHKTGSLQLSGLNLKRKILVLSG